MPRKIGYGKFTPARQAALRKAQLESARKRRKHHSDKRSSRKKKLAIAGAAAAAGVAVAAVYAKNEYDKSEDFKARVQARVDEGSRDKPTLFNTDDPEDKKKAIAFGKSITTQNKKDWYKTPEGKKQFDVIRSYTSDTNDYHMAHHLRTGVPLEQQPYTQGLIDTMDSAFNSEHVKPMSNWTEVTRGSSLKDFLSDDAELNDMLKRLDLVSGGVNGFKQEELDSLKEKMVDKEFTNKSFTSTSLGNKSFFDTKNTQVSFKLPPGTKGIYVAGDMESGTDKKDTKDRLSDEPHEQEVILRRNLKYKILDIKMGPKGQAHIIAEVLPHEQS